MKYQSELIKEIVDTRGHKKSSLHYESECVETWIEETKGAYPKLCDYQSEWLNYIIENPIGNFPYEKITDVTEATVNNVVPYAYKSAILKGQTLVNLSTTSELTFENAWQGKNIEGNTLRTGNKYFMSFDLESDNSELIIQARNGYSFAYHIHKGFVKGKNVLSFILEQDANGLRFQVGNDLNAKISNIIVLEHQEGMENWDIPYFESMQSVKMPVLTTSNEDGTKTNILTVNEDVTLRSNEDICDELNLLTGQLIQRIGEDGVVLSQEVVKTVDLIIHDQDGNTLSRIKPFEGTMHIHSDGTPLKPTITLEIPVEATTQNLASFIKEE